MPAAAEDPAAFSTVSRAALSQHRKPCFPTNIWAQAAQSPVGRTTERRGEPGGCGFRFHPLLVKKRKPKLMDVCDALPAKPENPRYNE